MKRYKQSAKHVRPYRPTELRDITVDTPLTHKELRELKRELQTLDKMFDSTTDSALLDSYEARIDLLIEYLERSKTVAQFQESGLTLIKGGA